MDSWKTTTAGVAGIVSVLAAALAAQFDNDPNTVANWSLVVSAIIPAIGLLFAKDHAA